FNPVQDDGKCQVYVDLVNQVDDQVKVEIVAPLTSQKELIYNMPRMVPGTYKVYDFGRFVNNLVAIGGRGDTLEVEQLNTNQWKIKDANKLYKVVYWADDTYDSKGKGIFAPAGTNFDETVNILNTFSFVGYFEGMKDYRYEYSVKKPEGQFGSTSLEKSEYSQEGVDVFLAKDYFELHDCPVLYAKPDTASVNVVGTVISIGVHSPEGNLKADEIMEGIEPVFHAAAEYLGGDLPAEKYTVLVYGMDLKQSMMGVGALEHHTSTVVNVPDISDQYLKMMADESMSQLLRDIVSHEFFHIVTPLNIHSEHIADYDFMNPQMSKHLWLYEGVTEYNANISQARAGILTEEQFMDNMFEKMSGDRSFNQHIPFTVSSEFALSYFEDQYLNVYEKGALIGMCLDLQLRIDSEGAYGLPNLLMELSTVYGKDTFFVDDELFDIIEAQTENENVREFFARYVEGAEPLPYRELLDHVGYLYQAEKTTRSVSDGGIVLGLKGDLVAVSGYRRNDAFVRSLGLNRRDVIVSWNGVKMNADNYQQVFDTFIQEAKIGDPVEVVVKRKSGEKEKKMKLNGNVQYHDEKELDVLEKKESPSPEEQAMKKAWMSN
ncbi:MAG: hypothetical protein N4A46_04065, partial [Schleiferiaceae bacterium]|nr:hypothetical protein [Schleiferiaceae bacterium]